QRLRPLMLAPFFDNGDRAFNQPIHKQCDRVSLSGFFLGGNAIAKCLGTRIMLGNFWAIF
ncbi:MULTISPECIES: hypothetical protein, partial [Spirulina sp. CCY15215]|uniref:hypothetical protein n=1 Tax=Spirulina sp. CCY15215 TaxID=2767591 RepID=UPI0019527D74